MANKNLNESLAGAVGDVATGAIDTAGDIGGAIPIVGGALKGAANIASRGVGAVLGTNQSNEEEAAAHALTHAQYATIGALKKEGWKKDKTEHKEHGHVVHLTKHSDRNTVHKCTVEPDGSVDKSQSTEPTHNENVRVANFLKSISQKNYSEADKYLGSLVNEKLKRLISRAAKK